MQTREDQLALDVLIADRWTRERCAAALAALPYLVQRGRVEVADQMVERIGLAEQRGYDP